MTRYLVVTPEMSAVVPILDFGQGPLEYFADVFECEAENARDAKIMAVRHWRRTGAKWISDCDGNPFAGLKAEVMKPCEFCGQYCEGCPGLLAADDKRWREELARGERT